MATEPLLAPLHAPIGLPRRRAIFALISDYWALTKPEISFLIMITTFTGFYLGRSYFGQTMRSGDFPFRLMIDTLAGTLLVASGTATLNQYIERRFDARMRRTARRPLAAGRLRSATVLWVGIVLSVLGSVYLALAVNLLASLLAAFTLLSYLFLYTPLKRKSPLCTLVGAVPGAMPPLIGWAAASGRLNFEAWILYAMLFLWQFPHFMAIAWMYREDYDRAGYRVLPQDDRARTGLVGSQTLVPLAALVCLSLLPALVRPPNFYYCGGAILLNLGFFYYGARFVLRGTNSAARRLLGVSIIYLPMSFLLAILAAATRT